MEGVGRSNSPLPYLRFEYHNVPEEKAETEGKNFTSADGSTYYALVDEGELPHTPENRAVTGRGISKNQKEREVKDDLHGGRHGLLGLEGGMGRPVVGQ